MSGVELGMVLLSALLHAVWNAHAKDTESPTAFLALLAIATVASGLLLVPFVDLGQVPASVWWIVPCTALIHTAYNICLGRAYERGDLSVVYPISRSTPAFVALIAIPVMNDPVSPMGAFGIGVVMLGMWLVHTDGRIAWKAMFAPGIGYAYLTLLTTVGYSILDKLAMKRFAAAPWQGAIPQALVYFYLLTTVQASLFVPIAYKQVPPGTFGRVLSARWGRLALGLVASVASYCLILEALRTASVSYVTAVRQSSVVFAAILSMLVLRESPSRPRLLGAILTVVGVASIALFP
jgi:drug/metabolite transporter (DMT)-like permease